VVMVAGSGTTLMPCPAPACACAAHRHPLHLRAGRCDGVPGPCAAYALGMTLGSGAPVSSPRLALDAGVPHGPVLEMRFLTGQGRGEGPATYRRLEPEVAGRYEVG
jgi:hypothetical protein